MHRRTDRKRILFVDDEENIRLTLPPLLEKHGFEVRSGATVPDALFEINSYEFDVLIADLNISEEGDGFLVVSAMRHLQPNCINLILTGYPALETALQAIRNHVDDYLIKPAELDLIISTIQQRLENRTGKPIAALKRLPALLKENTAKVTGNVLAAMKQHSNLSALSLADEARIQPLAKLVSAVFEHLESDGPDAEIQRQAIEYGRQRKKQGYSVAMIIADFLLLKLAIYDLIKTHLVVTDLAGLLSDLQKLESRLGTTVQKAITPYARVKRATVAVR